MYLTALPFSDNFTILCRTTGVQEDDSHYCTFRSFGKEIFKKN